MVVVFETVCGEVCAVALRLPARNPKIEPTNRARARKNNCFLDKSCSLPLFNRLKAVPYLELGWGQHFHVCSSQKEEMSSSLCTLTTQSCFSGSRVKRSPR